MTPSRLVSELTELYSTGNVFIVQAWKVLGRPEGMSLDDFKAVVVAAWRQRLITLARCDMPEALDNAQGSNSAQSETQWYGATFHFVRAQPW